MLIAVTFVPEEGSLYVEGLRLTIERLFLLLFAPYIFYQFASMTAASNYRFVWSDFLIPLTAGWMFIASWVMDGFDKALVSSGVISLEFALPYMAMRSMLKTPEQAVDLMRFIQKVMCVVVIIGFADIVLQRFWIHELFSSLTGYAKPWRADYRLGLFRATSTLEHPIHLGTACVLCLLAGVGIGGKSPKITNAILFTGAIATFSSGPLGGLFFGLGLFLYRIIMKDVAKRWLLLVVAVSIFTAIIYTLSNNPLGFFLSTFTFDSSSAYYRVIIWDVGSENVARSPIFGIGLTADWQRPDWVSNTVDAVWLAMAINSGIPSSVLMALSWIGASSHGASPARQKSDPLYSSKNLAYNLSIVTAVIIYIGFTVHFWGQIWVLISYLIGLRAFLGMTIRS